MIIIVFRGYGNNSKYILLRKDWSQALDEFGRVVTDLAKDFEMDATCTIKFHVIIIYVREHL